MPEEADSIMAKFTTFQSQILSSGSLMYLYSASCAMIRSQTVPDHHAETCCSPGLRKAWTILTASSSAVSSTSSPPSSKYFVPSFVFFFVTPHKSARLPPASPLEERALGNVLVASGMRLSCQVALLGPLEVEIPVARARRKKRKE